MSHIRRPMNNKVRKKANKEIKKAQKDLFKEEEPLRSDTLTVKQEIKKYPKKVLQKENAILLSLKKNIEIKKKKLGLHNASKRTTPGTVEGQPSAPASSHPEGKRWNQTLNLQNKVKRKAFTSKLNKKR